MKKEERDTWFYYTRKNISDGWVFYRVCDINITIGLIVLSSVLAPIRHLAAAAGRSSEGGGARGAQHDALCVREYGGDVKAALALDVHEEAIGGLDEALKLVLALLGLLSGVQKILGHID
jgi:hypothetical protein